MGKMIQVRNVPEKVHRRLKARAAEEGVSLSDYILRELRRLADRPTYAEIAERLRNLTPISFGASGADLVREGRDERDEQLDRVLTRR